MNLTKLKAALRLTIELAEKATPGPWEPIQEMGMWTVDGPTTGISDFSTESDASYIAQACNLGAPMAKALLDEIEWLERMITAETTTVEQHGFKFQLESRLTSILNVFPDI